MNEAPNAARAAAVAELERQQKLARERAGINWPIRQVDSLAVALAKADKRERESVVRDDRVYVPFYSYPLVTERLRWARTRDILNRSQPGLYEDGSYLEMVARQAASIEVVLRREYTDAPDPDRSQLCDRVLLGTLPTHAHGAYARRCGDFYFVQACVGLLNFVYQASKAAVLSWKPVAVEGERRISFKAEPQDIAQVLAGDPEPLRLLHRTLENYLFSGISRTDGFSPPPTNYQAPLVLLTNSNERFVLAHEYAHVLQDALDIVHPGNAAYGEEFASDLLAIQWSTESGGLLDRLPPNMSAMGAFFVLTAMDVVRQAVDLVRCGAVRADPGDDDHPPFRQRLGVLEEWFRQRVSREDDALSIRAAQSAARTLDILWQHLLADGSTDSWKGRTLHPIWQD